MNCVTPIKCYLYYRKKNTTPVAPIAPASPGITPKPPEPTPPENPQTGTSGNVGTYTPDISFASPFEVYSDRRIYQLAPTGVDDRGVVTNVERVERFWKIEDVTNEREYPAIATNNQLIWDQTESLRTTVARPTEIKGFVKFPNEMTLKRGDVYSYTLDFQIPAEETQFLSHISGTWSFMEQSHYRVLSAKLNNVNYVQNNEFTRQRLITANKFEITMSPTIDEPPTNGAFHVNFQLIVEIPR